MSNKFISDILPVQNTKNWGQQINLILQNLNDRIGVIEENIGKTDEGVEIQNIGYAGSGVVTVDKNELENNIINFEGNIYIGGPKNTYANVNLTAHLKDLDPSLYSYIYIKYTEDATKTFQQKCELVAENVFHYSWQYILIGVLYNNNEYIQKVFSSAKTSAQHLDEDYRRRIEQCNVSILDNFVHYNEESRKISININLNESYMLYGDGYSKTFINNYSFDDKRECKTNGSVIYCIDSLNISTGEIQTQLWDRELSTNGLYGFRLMLTNNGCAIVQKYYNNNLKNLNYNENTDTYKLEDLLLSLKFNNNLKDVNLLPSDFVEIGRFFILINGSPVSFDFSNRKFFYVKSHTNGLTPQASMNLWTGRSGDLYLDQTYFRNNSNGPYVKLEIIGNNDRTYKLSAENNANNSFILTSNYNSPSGVSINGTILGNYDIETGDIRCQGGIDIGQDLQVEGNIINNGMLTTSEIENNGALSTGTITLNEGSEILFASDRRVKNSIKKVEDNYLSTVINTPIVSFKYNNSNKDEFGLIAQDLQSNVSNWKCFINVDEDNEIPDKLSIKETKLVYILWKAIQEQQKEIEDLKKLLVK